ncbi:ras-related protein Rab-23-like [Bolinopsis microptera]|uniref:ras-related protein Rab-23-like n=1 Tax=Bolinopsis microptera TaxID=2820187 RepID=UPI003079E045
MCDMTEDDFEVPIKGVIVGNGAVGKSSMIQRYCKGIFTSEYKKTIGVDFLERQLSIEENDVRLMLWDTAGQEEFDAITRTYYRGGQIAVLAFSTTDRDSFDAIPSWKTKVEDEVGDIVMALVQNKVDLIDEAQMTVEEVEEMAKRLKVKLFRASVKEDFNIEELFKYLVSSYLSTRDNVVQLTVPEHKRPANPVTDNHSSKPSQPDNNPTIRLPVASGGPESAFELKPSRGNSSKKVKAPACTLL